MNPGSIDAPAKINLGLEILGLRDDGFHEIRSVLATISLGDTLTFEPATGSQDVLAVDGATDGLVAGRNLVTSALDALRNEGADIPPQTIWLTKRIPIAAGLGGASSDAAATLRFFGHQLQIPYHDLVRIAATLGSDVPFFLGAPCALVRGRGELLTPLPSPASAKWVVTVTPALRIPAKTATMYEAVSRNWWSSGASVEALASSFPRLVCNLPPNVFANALFSQFPEVAAVRDTLVDLGFPFVAVSGAGPTLFALFESADVAFDLAARAVGTLPSTTVHTAQLGAPSRDSSESTFHGTSG